MNFKFIAIIKFKFADYLRMICLPDTFLFSKDQLSQFHNQGQFLCCCILPILKFFFGKCRRAIGLSGRQSEAIMVLQNCPLCLWQPFPMCEFPWLFVKCRTDEILSSLIENTYMLAAIKKGHMVIFKISWNWILRPCSKSHSFHHFFVSIYIWALASLLP